MNKKTFLQSLRSGLNRMGIADVEEIIRDYENHFDAETAHGKSEPEIARELGDLKQILADFAPEKSDLKPAGRGAAITGLIVADFFVWIFLLVMLVGVFVPIGLGIAGFGLGVYYLAMMDFVAVFPQLSLPVSLLFGLTFLALGCWGFCATYFYGRFVGKTIRGYSRWGKRVLGTENPPAPEKPASPFWKKTAMISGMAFAIFLVAAYAVAAASAGNLEFWHVWHWFE
jgi:uncharacterized membrane protein